MAASESVREMRGATARFAQWSSALQYEAIPQAVIDHAKLCLLDGLGCGVFGSTQPWSVAAAEVTLALSGGGPATLLGKNASASVTDAAFVNGTATHGYEIDDIHLRGLMHPGAVTIPAVLALAEANALGGRDVLVALVAGYEVGLRVAMCSGIPHVMRGFHPTGTAGCLCAAAAAARLLELPETQTVHALSIAATQAAGLYCAVEAGAMTKRMHAGRAAQAGVLAALLAQKGYTGSTDVLEAPHAGYMSTLAENADLTPFVATLGSEWETAQVGFKAHAACASAHTTIDAVAALMKRGLTAGNLDKLTVHASEVGMNNVGWRYRPTSVTGAQMNGAFAAAVQLLDGRAFIEQYREERIADAATLRLIDKIEFRHDPQLDIGGAAKRHAVKVEARTVSGEVLSEYVEQRRGSAQHPLSRKELEEKFARTAGAVLKPAAVDKLLNAILTIEQAPDMRALSALLRG